MKRKLIMVALGLLSVGQVRPASSIEIKPARVVAEVDLDAMKAETEEEQIQLDMLKQAGIRSLQFEETGGATSAINFQENVFASGNFFLGANSDVTGGADRMKFSLTKVFRSKDGNDITLRSQALAPEKVQLNNAADQNNPIHGKQITNLALMGFAPVVTLGASAGAPFQSQVFYVGGFSNNGSIVKSNADSSLKDAAGNDVDGLIDFLTTSPEYIFAAVPQAGSFFQSDATNNGDNRGIALLKVEEGSIRSLNSVNVADTVAANRKAVRLSDVAKSDTAADRLFSFFEDGIANPITRGYFKGIADMHWDAKLQRLYVAFEGAKRNATNLEGGILGLFMGRFEGNELVLKPIVHDVTKDALIDDGAQATTNIIDRIIGFYFDHTKVDTTAMTGDAVNAGTDEVEVSIHKVRTMHTTTGHSYLIVASTIKTPDVTIPMVGTIPGTRQSGVFALPLVTQDVTTAGPVTSEDQRGVVAQVGTTGVVDLTAGAVPADALANMPVATQGPILIAEVEADKITDMTVVGDCVYFSMNNGTPLFPGDIAEKGIFKSTALFDAAGPMGGAVIGWTPLTRVMGTAETVRGMGIDPLSGNFFYLEDKSGKTVHATHWSKRVDMHDETRLKHLGTLLNNIFPIEKGGMFNIFNFDENTTSFKLNEFSMMVAIGSDTVALIQTGRRGGTTPNPRFEPVDDFVLGDNVFVFTADADLKTKLDATLATPVPNAVQISAVLGSAPTGIGPLTSADVLRFNDGTDPDDRGYLFVTGTNGLARLEHGTTVEGWDNFAGLDSLSATAAPIGGFVFHKFTNRDGELLLGVSGTNFGGDPDLDTLGLTELVETTDATAGAARDDEQQDDLDGLVCDMAVVANITGQAEIIITAGSGGVKVFDAGSVSNLLSEVDGIEGAPVKLHYVSPVKGRNDSPGNLYVFTIDKDKDMARVYRFHVDAGDVRTGMERDHTITPIDVVDATAAPLVPKPFIEYGDLRTCFGTDGCIFFTTRSQNDDQLDHLRFRTRTADNEDSNESTLHSRLERTGQKFDSNGKIIGGLGYTGVPVRDTASGMWIIPGEVRLNA